MGDFGPGAASLPMPGSARPGAAAQPGNAGTPEAATDAALRMQGLHERRDRDAIRQYLRTGGSGMDPATTAWCAAFVNSSLQQHGVQGLTGPGRNVATNYMTWGQAAEGGVQKGDVLVLPRGRRAGQVGGHVGMATGETRMVDGRLQYQMVSGNTGNRVGTTWERCPSRRRPPRHLRP